MPYKCVARKDTKKDVNVAKNHRKFAKTGRFNDIHLVTLLCKPAHLRVTNGVFTVAKHTFYEC